MHIDGSNMAHCGSAWDLLLHHGMKEKTNNGSAL